MTSINPPQVKILEKQTYTVEYKVKQENTTWENTTVRIILVTSSLNQIVQEANKLAIAYETEVRWNYEGLSHGHYTDPTINPKGPNPYGPEYESMWTDYQNAWMAWYDLTDLMEKYGLRHSEEAKALRAELRNKTQTTYDHLKRMIKQEYDQE